MQARTGQESLEGATTDDAKIKKVWTTIGSSTDVRAARRLGEAGRRRRPILVMVASREDRAEGSGKGGERYTRKRRQQNLYQL